jgi:hypothetical protein
MVAALKSEWVAAFKSEYPAGFIGIRTLGAQRSQSPRQAHVSIKVKLVRADFTGPAHFFS